MTTTGDADRGHHERDTGDARDWDEQSTVPPLVYTVVGIGLTVCVVALLLAGSAFELVTVVVALLVAAPFLLYARLAVLRPGPEAVIGGVLLLALGCWGAVSAVDDSRAAFVRLALYLVLVQLVVFGAGWVLRRSTHVPRDDD